jgi:hypothetical protein
MSDETFEGADEIHSVEVLTNTFGGGNYILLRYQGDVINHKILLCAVIVKVLQFLSSSIYF